ncbi:hypothetical protein GW915_00315, partial [bacterium]|nr:hypothetical protein [bacterium]
QQQFVKVATGKDIILKARQEGFSSAVGGIFTADFILDPNSYSVVLADISDNAEGLLDRVKFSLKSYEQKNGFKIPLKYNSKYELVNEAINSKYQIGTAENTDFGRSKTIKNLHMSEAAFFKHFRKLLAGALQAVRPDGRAIIETTANGFNEFKEFWDDSVRGETGFNPLFFSASSFYAPEFLGQKRKELGRLYVQEYPETAEQAFLTTGACFFDTDSLSVFMGKAREPIKEGVIYI